MFTKHFLVLFFITNLIAAVPVYAASAGQELSVEVYNLKHGGGQVGVNLFRNDDEMFANPYRVAHASIKEGKAVVVFENLPFGNYAAVAYHDENTNQKLDHHFLGYPDEPLGYSGGFTFSIFSGFPNFEKLKFGCSQNSQRLVIQVD
jgi:uncharacterized protein (DUF2141 family)